MTTVDSFPIEHPLPRQNARDRVKSQVVRAATERGILLVRTDDLPSEGLLSDRQKQWVNSPSYDAHTQNPILYKHEVERSRSPKLKRERDEAKHEVQSLPEVVIGAPSSSEDSGVVTRLRETRKERHESTIQDMKDELALISSEFEVQIQTGIKHFKSLMTENDYVNSSLFHRVSAKGDLGSKTLADLHALWEELSSQTQLRQGLIQTLDTRLSVLESQRAGTVTNILRDYTHQLVVIAYLLPCDVERQVEEEAHLINTTLLDNMKIYSQLCMHLSTGELSREREHRDRWEGLLEEWRELVCQATLNQFQAFLSSEPVSDPPGLQRVRESLVAEQKSIQRRREGILEQVATLVPPKATRTMVYEVKASADKLHQQLEGVHTSFLLGYQSCLESLSRKCEAEMERCRVYLVSSEAVDEASVHKLLNRLFVPLLEKMASGMRDELQEVERGLDATLFNQKAQFESLFSYSLGAAQLWDQHSNTLATSLRAFQERLEQCRSGHDRENQNLEANLDLLLDRLRQGPTQEALQEFLQEALRMLDTIKQGYEQFHTVVLEEVHGGPEMVQKELDWYDTALCQYLKVSRTPLKGSKSKINLSRAPSESSRTDIRRVDSRASKIKKSKPQRSKTTASGIGQSKSTLAQSNSGNSVVEEVITTSGGVSFYTLRSNTISKEDSTFLTQDEESESSPVSFATETIVLTQEVFSKAQDRMVNGLLEQLEQWRATNTDMAQTTLSGKEEECHTELDLRLHLHEPRPSRVERDIHNVRLAELVAHRDRITRHSTSLTTSVALQRGAGERLRDALLETKETFGPLVDDLVTELEACRTTTELLKVQDRAKECLQEHLREVTSISSEATRVSHNLVDLLDESNTTYRASIKLFSEGGNYCPEEVELFAKKLDKLSGKITSTWSHIATEMTSVTTAQEGASHKLLEPFNNAFKVHCADLSLLETVSRTLTSAQVRIKSEVAASNSQSKTISDHISKLRALLDKKSTPSSELLSHLPPLFELLTTRVDYLFCRATTVQGSRVGGSSGIVTSTSSVRPIGSMNVTKSIMEHITSTKHQESTDRKLSAITSAPIKTSDVLPPLTPHSDESKKSGRQSRKKMAILERKTVNFGIGGGGDESKLFLPRIRAVLRATHSELYKLTEAYYKSKGSRPSTRPKDIHEALEDYMDTLIAKTQSYRSQAEEYRNNCIQEFRDQLLSLMSVLEGVPGCVFTDLLRQWRESERKECETRLKEHTALKETSIQKRTTHQKLLRPGLGHPSQLDTLNTLCSDEEARYSELLERIASNAEAMREGALTCVTGFVNELSEMTKKLLALFDTVTSDSDIIPGESREKRSVEELLRRHVHGTATAATSSSAQLSRPPVTSGRKIVWSALPKSEFIVTGKKSELVSKKATKAHEAVIRERDAVFNEFCRVTDDLLEEFRMREVKERSLEDKWFENWTQSVHKVKRLYSS